MGSDAGTTSVIAKLMGLDDLPNQRPIQKRGRVLSEEYFQRVASIGVRERSPSPEKYSSRMGPKRPEDFSAFIRVVGIPRQDKLHMKEVDSKKLSLNGNVKSRRLEETSYALETVSKHIHIPTKIVLLRPHRGAEEISLSDFSRLRSSESSSAGCMKSRNFPGPSRYWKDSSHEIELVGQRPRVSSEEVEEIARQVKSSNMISMSLCAPNWKKSQNIESSVSSSNSSYIAQEAKKEMSERFMMIKESQEPGSGSRRKTLGEMLSMQSQRMGPRNVNCNSHDSGTGMKNATHDINRSKRLKVSRHSFEYKSRDRDSTSKEVLQPGKAAFCYTKSHSRLLDPECNSSISGLVLKFDSLRNEAGSLSEGKDVATSSVEEDNIASRSLGAHTATYETPAWSLEMKESVSSSNCSENLAKEEEPAEFPEEDAVSMRSSIGPESFKSFEEPYQPSPDSVLEPLEEGISSDLGLDLSGMQTLPFKLESLEECLEKHRMTVSSDEEDDDERSSNNFEETADFMRFLRAEESRDFLYLVNVLSEAGLNGGNLMENLIKWHSTATPVDPSIFEILEIKYGEQKSWKRSERKLLFDRINLGLIDILLQSISMPSWAKPVSARISSRPDAEITEEALWTLLLRQENEARKESENVLGDDLGWSDLGECVDIVSREIQELLIEELAAEFF
ncbi:uncharacterized protein LOC116188097 [Punica granatum]|uniref:Uncharacterized protein LOC116188097 n=2 Tax=Punica granatum TaxID=22663 RepID=A0A6P8BUH3_PUNGR|nr:uncharacterized protein LOC116188097 [Punica granatum]XP_031373099.1 uncharacterized protein LOC116188097 [Punica granatum]XP_031373100.1 uncharacterized protein LOC116188097 [Punica granatum]XP_031373101.1 uncharacterized protein LOC116188097 [Punica granatum]OWM87539.1 hypothetical protein CDL15_Pgr022651 [Punica granatum]PKI74665.1 hypothetical protein CRG98_004992 [Punica granatum]